jgi:hypothetical protein
LSDEHYFVLENPGALTAKVIVQPNGGQAKLRYRVKWQTNN